MIWLLVSFMISAWIYAVSPVYAQTIIRLCQNENAVLGVLTTHGNNTWAFAGSTTHVTGWETIRPGGCFRDLPNTFLSREYAIAGRASDGTIVPLDLTFNRIGSLRHHLKTGQICVPTSVKDLSAIQLRKGAEHPPCRQGERSFPTSLFFIAGNELRPYQFDLDVTQAEVDRLAGLAPTPAPPKASRKDKAPTAIFREMLKPRKPEEKPVTDPDRWKVFVGNCMSSLASAKKRASLNTCICHEALYSAYGNTEMYDALTEDYAKVIDSHTIEELVDIMKFSRGRNDLCSFGDSGWSIPEYLQSRRSEFGSK